LTSHKLAADYIAKVEARLEALRLFLSRNRYDDVVREAHEAMELLLKGALRFVGVDPPRRHDPAPVVARHIERFPSEWKEHIEEIQEISERLSAERGHAFYGDEDELLPPSELFEEAAPSRRSARSRASSGSTSGCFRPRIDLDGGSSEQPPATRATRLLKSFRSVTSRSPVELSAVTDSASSGTVVAGRALYRTAPA
jgi:HEPN domain-containing protein